MLYHLLAVSSFLLFTVSTAFTSIQWTSPQGDILKLMPKSFTGHLPRSYVLPQILTIGETSNRMVPQFTAKSDNTISVGDWCVEADGKTDGDAVIVSNCIGGPVQQWNWISGDHGRNMIQLKGTNLCLNVNDKEGSLIGAAVHLQTCGSESSASWLYEVPGSIPVKDAASGSGVRHAEIVFASMTLFGVMGIGAWLWRWRAKSFATPVGQYSMPLPAVQSGGSLIEPWRAKSWEKAAPAVMAMNATPASHGPTWGASMPAVMAISPDFCYGLRGAATTSCIDRFDAEMNPSLARIVQEGKGEKFEEGKDFRIVCLESGSQRGDLPVFTTVPGAVPLDANSGAASRVETEGVMGGFLLRDVASPRECDQLIRMLETMGFTEDAPVSLARNIRKNENCVWLADDVLNDGLFERCRTLFPVMGQLGEAVGLNARWRAYKYNPSDIFKVHTDGGWPGSGLDSSGSLVRDRYGDRWSLLTFVLYLNDDFDGGPTRFFYPIGNGREHRVAEVAAERGAAICFPHGEHPHSPLHEGGLVTKGTKYIIRSDVLYKMPK